MVRAIKSKYLLWASNPLELICQSGIHTYLLLLPSCCFLGVSRGRPGPEGGGALGANKARKGLWAKYTLPLKLFVRLLSGQAYLLQGEAGKKGSTTTTTTTAKVTGVGQVPFRSAKVQEALTRSHVVESNVAEFLLAHTVGRPKKTAYYSLSRSPTCMSLAKCPFSSRHHRRGFSRAQMRRPQEVWAPKKSN